MKEKKKYIIVFVILAIYILIIFLTNGKNIIRENFDSVYMMISPSTQWKFEKGNWTIATNIVDYSLKSFHTYVDNKPFGNYNVTYNNKFYLFDDKRNSIKYDGNLIAIRGSIPIDIINFKDEKIEPSIEVVSNALKEKNINASIENIRVRKIEIDLDNDRQTENIYITSNVFYAKENEDSFALVFIVENNQIVYIYEEIEKYIKTLEMCTPYIQNIIDIDKDKKYEIVMGCEYFSNNGVCHNLYDNKTNRYKNLLKNC